MRILPLRSPRLLLRPMRPDDAELVAAYRNDPEVARYQDWPLPVSAEQTAQRLAQQAADDLVNGAWVSVAIEFGNELVGDLGVRLDHDGALATIGYSLRPQRWGRGIAREAVGTMVDALFASGVHRIVATLDPENRRSLRVLEYLGFTVECHARRAEMVRGEWVDDLRCALLRDDRAAWLARPTSVGEVRLVELAPTSVRAYGRLTTHRSQESLVAPMWASFADALFPEVVDGAPLVPWMRGIEADGAPVGFVMVADTSPSHPVPYLWRLLIDRRFQRAGIGRAAVGLVAAHFKNAGHSRLLVSWVDDAGGPRPFYERLGFTPTGTVLDGEIEAALEL